MAKAAVANQSAAHTSGLNEVSQVAHAFNEMAREVGSLIEEQCAFASNTSHELRTPLRCREIPLNT